MIGGVFKFVLAFVVFIVVGVVANPAIAAIFNGYTLPGMGVFACQLLAAGFVVSSGK